MQQFRERARAFFVLPVIAAVIVSLGAGAAIGWLFGGKDDDIYRPYREENPAYAFINPLLFVDVGEDLALPRFGALKDAITTFADAAEAAGDVSDMSIYFRALNTSQWVAVHGDERFAPASMVKVITLMTVLREVENDPALLSKKVQFEDVEKDFPIEHTIYPPRHPVESWKAYTVDTLLKKLIVESDNGADYGLTRLMGPARMRQTYDDLHIQQPKSMTADGFTAREYSRVFRTLYNSTYLPRDLSEQALKLLSATAFTRGIVAGVPEGTVVSHKFGVRGAAASAQAEERGEFVYEELHDCGIVYYPDDPYFLCVMTRGKDFASLERVLQNASRIVWEEFGNVH